MTISTNNMWKQTESGKFRCIRSLIVVVILSLVFISGQRADADVYLVDFDEDRAEFLMLQAINMLRYSEGLPLVSLDSNLARSSHCHAVDMARRDYFDHFSPDNESPDDRARRFGVPNRVSENIGIIRTFGKDLHDVVDSLMEGFLSSRDHQANIMDPDVTHVGIGFYQDLDGSNQQLNTEADPDAIYRGYGTVLVVQDFCRRNINLVEPDPYPEWMHTGEFITLRLEFIDDVEEVFLRIIPHDETLDVYEIPMSYRENLYQARFAIENEGDFTIGIYAVSPEADWFYRELGSLDLEVTDQPF